MNNNDGWIRGCTVATNLTNHNCCSFDSAVVVLCSYAKGNIGRHCKVVVCANRNFEGATQKREQIISMIGARSRAGVLFKLWRGSTPLARKRAAILAGALALCRHDCARLLALIGAGQSSFAPSRALPSLKAEAESPN